VGKWWGESEVGEGNEWKWIRRKEELAIRDLKFQLVG
jgi:hypothetical protein